MASEAEIRAKYEALNPVMDERMSRLWAAAEADAIGEGGIAAVERATGLSRTTIRMGSYELAGGVSPDDVVNVRRAGGGRPRIEETRPEILGALEALVDPVTRGDPESPLRWTSKSTRKLANELRDGGYTISPQKVGQLLHAQGYSLQGTYKTLEGSSHPDRNEQFEFINARVDAAHVRGAPVISVDTKKKELVGDFKNAGREWQPEGRPVPVRVHDFADRSSLTIGVSHFPPGTSKWNKIEHRLFCHITENWRGRPLVDHETIVNLIGSVRTSKGLVVKAKLDTRSYPTGVIVSDDEMEAINILCDPFHGEWNYTILPRSQPSSLIR